MVAQFHEHFSHRILWFFFLAHRVGPITQIIIPKDVAVDSEILEVIKVNNDVYSNEIIVEPNFPVFMLTCQKKNSSHKMILTKVNSVS